MKNSYRIILLFIFVIITSTFFLALLKNIDQSSEPNFKDWNSKWRYWAEAAWRYFQPGVGVDPYTGLHYSNIGYHPFTDWDVGTYLMAILDAEKINLVQREGDWGVYYRLEKIFSFLETRSIRSDGKPFWSYVPETGKHIGGVTHPSDAGKLLLALNEVRSVYPEFSNRILAIVERYNFTSLGSSPYFGGNSFYEHYSAQGFHAFGIATPELSDIYNLAKGEFIDVYGVSIPKIDVTTEPLILSALEGRSNQLYEEFSYRVYKAQENRYRNTGKLTAFSEGSYPSGNFYIYEWVVTSSGKTWQALDFMTWDEVSEPEIFTKTAFAYYALYPSEYSESLIDFVSNLNTPEGFYEGRLESGTPIKYLSDKTNGMIIQAARYALSKPVNVSIDTPITKNNGTSSVQYSAHILQGDIGIRNVTVNSRILNSNGIFIASLNNKTDSIGVATFKFDLASINQSEYYLICVDSLGLTYEWRGQLD